MNGFNEFQASKLINNWVFGKMIMTNGKLPEEKKNFFEKQSLKDSGYKKAAALLVLLGQEQASKVMAHLKEDEVLGITKEIAQIDKIEKAESKKVLQEFGYLLKVRDLYARGGLDTAKEMLLTAFGEKKGMVLFEKIAERTNPHPFSFLNDLSLVQVKGLIKDESAAVIAVILAHISPELSGKILPTVDKIKQKEIIKRLANLEKIDPEVMKRIEETLMSKVKSQGNFEAHEIDGKNRLIEIMKNLDGAREKDILNDLYRDNPELAGEIEEKLFSMDIVYRIQDKDFQAILREWQDKDIALILKGKSDRLKERFMNNLSSRRKDLVKLEYNSIGQVRKSEVDELEGDFLRSLRKKAEAKEIVILDDNDEYIN
ncbi:MAG: hypothetical protein JXR70_01635 [Spirochaetales bacterium]|nr:hypothetical protein [Spirochaetales bacterium]